MVGLVIEGRAVTVKTRLSVEGGQPAFVIVHRKTYAPAPPAGVNVVAGLVVLLNCPDDVLGPLTTLHDPVPVTGVFADRLAAEPAQMD